MYKKKISRSNSVMIFLWCEYPGGTYVSRKRISFCVLSARMTNPSSSTSRGEFYMNGNTCAHTHTPTHRRKRGSQTPAGSATPSKMALEPHIWRTEVLCHTVILSDAAYMFHWELSLRVCEWIKRPFKKAWVWVSDLTATTVKHVITNRSNKAIETGCVDTFQLSFPVVVWSSK